MRKLRKFVFLFIFLLVSKYTLSFELENVIADANLYTVKIDVSTEMPLLRIVGMEVERDF